MLVDEFGHHQPREKIQEIMDDSVSQLVGSAEVEDFLPALAHRFTRERLKALARARTGRRTRNRTCSSSGSETRVAVRWPRRC